MANKIKLEIVCGNIESVIAAQQGGADRVELCEHLDVGGLTPGSALIEMSRKKFSLSIHVMIRPRAGDFLYSGKQFDRMKRDIGICKRLKADGVVFGILKKDSSIDKEKTKELVTLSKPLSVTFHRAFDRTNDPVQALEDVIECGCQRVLTSGLKTTAMEGVEIISMLIKQSKGRIIIMPGGKVRPSNVVALISKTGATEIHSSALSEDESKIPVANIQTIKELKAIISST